MPRVHVASPADWRSRLRGYRHPVALTDEQLYQLGAWWGGLTFAQQQHVRRCKDTTGSHDGEWYWLVELSGYRPRRVHKLTPGPARYVLPDEVREFLRRV